MPLAPYADTHKVGGTRFGADLWAACIGGAAQRDAYRDAIESAGLRIQEIRENPYEFISEQARNASVKFGVKSVSLVATKA